MADCILVNTSHVRIIVRVALAQLANRRRRVQFSSG